MRRRLIGARRTRSDPDRAAAAAANEGLLVQLLSGTEVVCAYLPLPSEPMTAALLDRLTADGVRVLVPVVRPDAPLDWCRYPSPTAPGPFGIAEPTGPRLGPTAVQSADAVLVPALAVDPAGRRLGRGGGHYDRTLALPVSGRVDGAGPALIGVLFADELVDRVPAEDHDVPVGLAVLATAGIRHFRR